MTGVDGSAAMLERARVRSAGITLVVGDLRGLPLADDTTDLVVTGLALTHVADLVPVYMEFARVLCPAGDLVVSDVHPDLLLLGSVVKVTGPKGQPQMATTYRHSTADHLRAALAAGFTVCRDDESLRPVAPTAPPTGTVLGDR